MTIILLIVIGVLAVALGYMVSMSHIQERAKTFLNTERHLEKERRKKMLLKHLRSRGKITNDEVEALLGVSDSTATVYFDELEEEGKIVQKGESGRGVYYELAE